MTLPPARPPARPDPGRDAEPGGAGPPGPGRPIPVPVRSLREPPDPAVAEATQPDSEPSPVSVVYEAGASTWRVTVVGEAGGPSFARGAALLFLRFEDEGGGAGAPREGWAVGPLPGALEAAGLAAALEHSRPWSEGRPKEGFFDEMDGRRGR